MKSEPVEIQVATLRVILEKLCKPTMIERIKELDATDTIKLEALSRRRLKVTIRSTGEIWEISN